MYEFEEDERLIPGWAFFLEGEEAICFTLDDWADNPDMIGPEVGVIHVHPEDAAEIRAASERTLH